MMQKNIGEQASRIGVLKGSVAAAALLVACWGGAARADTLAASPTGGTELNTQSYYSFLGFQFTVTNAGGITVTGLGVWMPEGGSTIENNYVAILQSNTDTLISGTVADGTSTSADGVAFATLNSGPVFLAAGTYEIGAYYTQGNSDPYLENATPNGGTGITIGDAIDEYDTSGNPGTITSFSGYSYFQGGVGSYFGPDFTYELGNQIVPEPASLTLVGGALIGLGALRRRRTRSA